MDEVSFWDQIVPLIPVMLAAIPGLIALAQQQSKQKAEKKVKDAEEVKIKADAVEVLTKASGNIQDQYRELIEDIKISAMGCKDKLEELLLQNIELNKKVNEQGRLLKEANEKISSLENKVAILTKQLKDAGITPLINNHR